MKHRIGLVYIPGVLPCFEAFGNLPTDLVQANGLVGGKSASEALDMIIIPGGSLAESQSIKGNVEREILRMAQAGKFVLGICSGFQILSQKTDVGRLSPKPIVKEGLGLLDVEFKPLICTDQVTATITGTSFLTGNIGAQVLGFHCHTYGDITLHHNAKTVLVSHVDHLDYRRQRRDLVSGVTNHEGNVVGVLPHALLDHNPAITEGITESLNLTPKELAEIHKANAKLQAAIKSEIGIATDIHLKKGAAKQPQPPRALLMTALESGSGKTFLATGLAAALKKRGVNVGVVKIGADIRDLVPALYLIKEPIRGYSSMVVADCGWKRHTDALNEACRDYEFVIVEGAMDAFTGLLFKQIPMPRSTAEIAASLGIPTVVVVGCDKEGVEGGMVGVLNYLSLLKSLGVKTAGVILNRMCMGYLTREVKQAIKEAFANAGVEVLGIVPIVEVEGRGAIPEVEIRYEEFGAKALQTAEGYFDLDKIMQTAAPPTFAEVDFEVFADNFRKDLLRDPRARTAKADKKL
jgi:cobyric acid synthase